MTSLVSQSPMSQASETHIDHFQRMMHNTENYHTEENRNAVLQLKPEFGNLMATSMLESDENGVIISRDDVSKVKRQDALQMCPASIMQEERTSTDDQTNDCQSTGDITSSNNIYFSLDDLNDKSCISTAIQCQSESLDNNIYHDIGDRENIHILTHREDVYPNDVCSQSYPECLYATAK